MPPGWEIARNKIQETNKFQIANSKFQINLKNKSQMAASRPLNFYFEIYLEFGICYLESVASCYCNKEFFETIAG